MYAILGVVGYLGLARFLRYRLIDQSLESYLSTHALCKGSDGSNPSDYLMTPVEAQEIIRISSAYDMPYLVGKSVEFALFKVFGIVRNSLTRSTGTRIDENVKESISTILLGTGQLTKEANAGRRFVDTGVLIATWMNVPITGPGSGREKSSKWEDPRGAIAIARTNWLHSKYKISVHYICKIAKSP
ncbi:hypothetical protein FRC09_019719 [Ceratobasidium sp. 395]|nr:hypothetical protein FRC09_019719 [Ceratobasidium sp. 395]